MRKGKVIILVACLLTLSLVISLMLLASCSKKRQPQEPAVGTTKDAPKTEVKKAEAAVEPVESPKINTTGQASKPKVEQQAVKAETIKEPNKATAAAKTQDANSAAKKVIPAVEKSNLQKLLQENRFWKQVGKDWYGTKIRDVNLTDIDGKTHKISDYKGRDLIVVSFAWWCPGSEAQIKYFMVELRKEISEKELVILGIAAKTTYNNDSIEKLREFIAKYKVNFPVCYIEPEKTPAPFNSNLNVPCSYFINRNGNLMVAIQDIITTKFLKRVLEAMQ